MTKPCIYEPQQPNIAEIKRLLDRYPISAGGTLLQEPFSYGTAGFRYKHEVLPPIIVRIAVFAALRSASLDGEPVGLMITASHNPECDNGIKLSDSNGGMLPLEWEEMATKFVNADRYVLKAKPKMGAMVVHIGRDTRSHSLALAQLAVRSAVSFGAVVIDHGCVTTPQLHYYVLRSNPHLMPNALMCGSSGCSFEQEYLTSIVGSYAALISTKISNDSLNDLKNNMVKNRTLLVDCACGVGGLKIPLLNELLQSLERHGGILLRDSSLVKLIPVNLPGEGPLNERCGAEFVQKQQTRPTIYSECHEMTQSHRMSYVASLDGDADRIVFHYLTNNDECVLLDGDKIAVLISIFLQEEILALSCAVPEARDLNCGVVQTAYANGSSTSYLKNQVKTKVVIAKTGVKHVHTAAHDHYDVGIYFEANGHGTVLFGPNYYKILAKAEEILLSRPCSRKNRATIAWQRLRVLPRLINQAVGDALSDLFLVDAILYLKGWSLASWNGLYVDMPSRQCKVQVKDRTIICTNDNETRTTSPPGLQEALDAAMASLRQQQVDDDGMKPKPVPRTFVRPSGTEDAVRVYAEAATQYDADMLASEAALLVYKICNGIGSVPSFTNQCRL